MKIKKILARDGRPERPERRVRRRVAANFYAIELVGTARYLRRVENVSGDGLLLETPLGDETPGQQVNLVLPCGSDNPPLEVSAVVVNVRPGGHVGLRVLSEAPLPVEALGGSVAL
jgi:hypothetical protein